MKGFMFLSSHPEFISGSGRCKYQRDWTLKQVQRDRRLGFTLIELLVVVLIIGILAGIALPQYNKAVRRSRSVQMMVLAKALKDAEEVHYMANGSYTLDFESLDIQPPAGCTIQGKTVTCNKPGYKLAISLSAVNLSNPSYYLLAIRENANPYIMWQYQLDRSSVLPGKKICFPQDNDAAGLAFCKSFGGTPTGAYSGWYPGMSQGYVVD